MGLQEQIAEAIVIAFDELGGDPQKAVDAAMRHNSVKSWRQQEVAITSFAGGAELAIPGLHALTIPAGISYLMHKMAYISWGIGALKGNYIVETTQHSDLRNILTLWANSTYYDAHILEHVAISMDAFQYAITEEGRAALTSALDNNDDRDNIVIKTLGVLDDLVTRYGGDERSQRMVQSISGEDVALEMVLSAKDSIDNNGGTVAKPFNRRISTRLAGRLAARISARVPARLVMGFIPLAGPIVNAFFNAQTLGSMADTAEKYYDNPLRSDALRTDA